jgi:hypothetical protein
MPYVFWRSKDYNGFHAGLERRQGYVCFGQGIYRSIGESVNRFVGNTAFQEDVAVYYLFGRPRPFRRQAEVYDWSVALAIQVRSVPGAIRRTGKHDNRIRTLRLIRVVPPSVHEWQGAARNQEDEQGSQRADRTPNEISMVFPHRSQYLNSSG